MLRNFFFFGVLQCVKQEKKIKKNYNKYFFGSTGRMKKKIFCGLPLASLLLLKMPMWTCGIF